MRFKGGVCFACTPILSIAAKTQTASGANARALVAQGVGHLRICCRCTAIDAEKPLLGKKRTGRRMQYSGTYHYFKNPSSSSAADGNIAGNRQFTFSTPCQGALLQFTSWSQQSEAVTRICVHSFGETIRRSRASKPNTISVLQPSADRGTLLNPRGGCEECGVCPCASTLSRLIGGRSFSASVFLSSWKISAR